MFKKNEISKTKVAIVVLCLVILTLVGYVVYDKTTEHYNAKVFTAYNQGYEQAKFDVLGGIYQTSENCQTTRISVQNYTKQLVDVACLQQQQPQQTS